MNISNISTFAFITVANLQNLINGPNPGYSN